MCLLRSVMSSISTLKLNVKAQRLYFLQANSELWNVMLSIYIINIIFFRDTQKTKIMKSHLKARKKGSLRQSEMVRR